MADSPLVFLDTETTSLNRRTRLAWEVALIVRGPDGRDDYEKAWRVEDVDLSEADPMSLKIGRFHERFKRVPAPMSLPEAEVAVEIERETRGAVLIGAVPSFDEETLAGMLYRHGLCPTWHYHLVDVETLAAGALRMPPRWDFDSVLAAYGLTYDEADRHTALGDARMVRDLYDAVMQRPTK
jgi:DNA polymerase III epsilon subunit-like protein